MSQPFEDRMKKLLESELLRACSNGEKNLIAQLVDDKKVALDCNNELGLQPLMISAKQGDFEIVQYLLFHNTDILDNTDSAGWSSLHWSVLNGHYLVSKELIEFGAELDLKSFSDKIYPLHLSIFANKPTICKLLLDNNCAIDILYNDSFTITELLDYVQYKLKLLNQNQINKFKNIIFHSKQYKQFTKTTNGNNNSNNLDMDDGIIEDITDIDIDDDDNDNVDDDDTDIVLKSQRDAHFEEIKKKYFNDDDLDSTSSDTTSDDEVVNEDDEEDDEEDDDDDDEDICDIIRLLPQRDEFDLDLDSDSIINEEEEEEEEPEEGDEEKKEEIQTKQPVQAIETETETKTETEIKTETETNHSVSTQTENTNMDTNTDTDIKTADTNIISNGIISINLDLLTQSIQNKFITKNDFQILTDKQLSFNEMIKEEQSKSLKELIDINKEINDINNEIHKIKERKENEIKRTEIESMLDAKLSKYELWLQANVEHKINKNIADIGKINALIKTDQIKQPSIETLKVGKIIETELKRIKANNIINSYIRKKRYKRQKRQKLQKHIKSPSLDQSFSSFNAFVNNMNNDNVHDLEGDEDEEDEEEEKDGNEDDHIRHIINIQQNIFNSSTDLTTFNSLKTSKEKEKINYLQLKTHRHSEPITLPNNITDNNENVLCTVETPFRLDENNKMKPKPLRRRRSNSCGLNSPKNSLHFIDDEDKSDALYVD